jgi:saccharolysin
VSSPSRPRCSLLSSAVTLAEQHAAVDAAGWYSPKKDLDALLGVLSRSSSYPSSVSGYRWDWSAEAIVALASEFIHRTETIVAGIVAVPAGAHTFANTLGAFSTDERIFRAHLSNVNFLAHVSPDKALRDVSTEQTVRLVNFLVTIDMRVDLYEALKAFSVTAEAIALTGERARLLEQSLRDSKRHGLHLPLADRERIEALKKRIGVLGIEFKKNLGEENGKLEFTKAQLSGVPEDQLARFEKSNTDPEKYVVSLKTTGMLVTHTVALASE